jgi:hypothetical protein
VSILIGEDEKDVEVGIGKCHRSHSIGLNYIVTRYSV